MTWFSGLALCLGLLLSCQPTGDGGKQEPPAQASPSPKAVEPSTATGADAQVARVKSDLAQRLGITAAAVQITDIQKEQWGDTSLGCAEPGKMYAQVITPGYRILAEAQGKSYEYHTDEGAKAVLCTK